MFVKRLVDDFDAYGLELLPTSLIGKAYHKVIIARIDVRRNGDVKTGFVLFHATRYGEVLIVDPRIDGLLDRI